MVDGRLIFVFVCDVVEEGQGLEVLSGRQEDEADVLFLGGLAKSAAVERRDFATTATARKLRRLQKPLPFLFSYGMK